MYVVLGFSGPVIYFSSVGLTGRVRGMTDPGVRAFASCSPNSLPDYG
jgi:hypothetical protein